MKHTQTHILIIALLIWGTFSSLCKAQEGNNLISLKTVCIDAGHGGDDPGCVSRDKSQTYEKNITLAIAKSLRDKINAAYPEVKVILTRSNDTFVTLNNRANIANKNNADLFISIHINAAASKSSTANGYSVHVLGQSSDKNKDLFQGNLELTKRENSVILLEDDYTTTYQGFDPNDPESFIFFNLMQNAHLEQSLEFADIVNKRMSVGPIPHSRGIHQDAFLVLWKTTMPSVLIECGFISSASDLAILKQENSKDKIAQCIFNAFADFKSKYDGTTSINLDNSTAENIANKAGDNSESSADNNAEATAGSLPILYGTQILVSSKILLDNDSFFKGYTPLVINSGKINKYIVGASESAEEAKENHKKIKNYFKDSFLVKIEGNKISALR